MPESTAEVARAWHKAFLATVFACLIFTILSLSTSSNVLGDIFLLLLLFIVGIAAFIFIAQAILASSFTKQFPSYYLLGGLLTTLAATGLSALYAQGRFYGREVLTATFRDDMSGLDLQLFEDGHYIMISGYVFGADTYRGRYTRTDSTITFDHFPVVENDFVAQTVLLKGNRIYFRPQATDTSYYHFTIRPQ
jgi:hypothetical protein